MRRFSHRRDLFGGALFAAGIAALTFPNQLTCADFVPEFEFNKTRIKASGSGGALEFFDEVTGAAFPESQYFAEGELAMSSYAGPTRIGASASLEDPAFWNYGVFNYTLQTFSIGGSFASIILEWDFTNLLDGDLAVYEFGVGNVFVAPEDTAGSFELTLEPDVIYNLFASVRIEAFRTGNGFARASTIPAPSAIALVVGSLVSLTKRRRRV